MAKQTTDATEKPTPEPVAPEAKRLYRIPSQGKIAGVCAGLAEYLAMDVTVIRIIFVVLALASGGFGVIVYLILAVVLPVKDAPPATGSNIQQNINRLSDDLNNTGGVERLRTYAGIGLIVFGAWLLLGQLFPGWLRVQWSLIWPAALVVLGFYLLTRSRKE